MHDYNDLEVAVSESQMHGAEQLLNCNQNFHIMNYDARLIT